MPFQVRFIIKIVMKRFFGLIIVFCMMISMCIFAYAEESNDGLSNIAEISQVICDAEELKSEFGLSEVNFSSLTVSDAIIAYDYTENGFVYNSEFIPVKLGNDLIAWVIKTVHNSDILYQFSVAYIDIIRSIVNKNTDIAIIYDYNNCYLYDGIKLYKLASISLKVDSRIIIDESDEVDFSVIELNHYEKTYSLWNYFDVINSRVPAYISCNVPFVSQNPPSNMCWAASIACISNYVYGSNRTAESVAQYWYGTSNYNIGLPADDQEDVLRAYGLNYTYIFQVPSDSVIYRNINIGYPILARFIYTGGAHAVVINGINITAGYISIMDPEFGFARANYSSTNGYTYVSAYSGVTLTIESASCMTWSS